MGPIFFFSKNGHPSLDEGQSANPHKGWPPLTEGPPTAPQFFLFTLFFNLEIKL